MLKRRLILLVMVTGVVVIAVSIVVMLYRGIFAQPPILTVSNGTMKISLLGVQHGDLCFKYSYWKQDTRVYEIIHAEEGRVSYLIKLKIMNTGSETCFLYFYLRTSKGARGPFETGVEKIIFIGKDATSEQKVLIEKCTEKPEGIIRDMISLYYSHYLLTVDIPPKYTKDVWLLYGLEPGEKVVELKVIAMCLLAKQVKMYSLEIPLPEQ